jgi:hypothetical protein
MRFAGSQSKPRAALTIPVGFGVRLPTRVDTERMLADVLTDWPRRVPSANFGHRTTLA